MIYAPNDLTAIHNDSPLKRINTQSVSDVWPTLIRINFRVFSVYGNELCATVENGNLHLLMGWAECGGQGHHRNYPIYIRLRISLSISS